MTLLDIEYYTLLEIVEKLVRSGTRINKKRIIKLDGYEYEYTMVIEYNMDGDLSDIGLFTRVYKIDLGIKRFIIASVITIYRPLNDTMLLFIYTINHETNKVFSREYYIDYIKAFKIIQYMMRRIFPINAYLLFDKRGEPKWY